MTDHRWMAMALKAKPNHLNGSIRKSQDWKKHVKLGQMWKFCSLFSSIGMAWCIMNSCHKVVRSIRNTILKLCAECAKQFVRNAQNYGKSNHGFCTMITHIGACAWVFGQKKKTVIMRQPPYSPDLASVDFLLFQKLKTPM